MTYHILGSPIRYIPPRFMVKNKTGIALSISAGDTISLSSVINSSLSWRVSVIRIYTSRKISSCILVTRLLDFISSGIVIRYIKLPSSFEKTWWKPTSNSCHFIDTNIKCFLRVWIVLQQKRSYVSMERAMYW